MSGIFILRADRSFRGLVLFLKVEFDFLAVFVGDKDFFGCGSNVLARGFAVMLRKESALPVLNALIEVTAFQKNLNQI